MKNKKTLIIVSIIVIAVIGVGLFLASGRARTDVYLKDFEVSADGKTITLKVGVSSSAGYVRKIKQTSGSSNGYYTFYSTYGINSKFGAKDTFEIDVNNDADEIYFYAGDKGYRLVLAKYDPTQEWEIVNYGTMKIKLPDKEIITKFAINTLAQDNNYTEYSDRNIIESVYNVLNGLETTIPSTTVNPEGQKDEIYDISFDTDEYEDKVEWHTSIYKKDGKCYVEQRYNGIYEIEEEDFNLIKNYIK